MKHLSRLLKRFKVFIVYYRKWLWVIGNIITVLVLSTIIGGVVSMSILLQDDLPEKQILAKFFPIIRLLRKTTDIIYLPYFFYPSKLSLYSIEIQKKDLDFLNKNLPTPYSDETLTSQYKKEVPAKLFYKGKEYKAEVRYRGQHDTHWSAPQKSWFIRIKGKKLPDGRKEMDLILTFDRQYIIQELANYRAKKLGLLAPASRFVRLEVNGKMQGVYWEVEGWTGEMVERENNLSADTDIYAREWDFTNRSDFGNIAYWKKHVANPLDDRDYSNLQKLVEVISEHNDQKFFEQIGDIVDLEKFYLWQINSMLLDSPHGYGQNLKLYFNKDTGKFEFISWDVAQIDPAPEVFDPNFNVLIGRVFKNEEFIRARNQLLWDYVKDDTNLNDDLAYYDRQYKEMRIDTYKDRKKVKSNLQFDWEVGRRKQRFVETYKNVQKTFRDLKALVKVKVNMAQENNLAEIFIGIEGFSSLKFEGIDFEIGDDKVGQGFFLYGENDKKISDFTYFGATQKYKSDDLNIIFTAQRDTKSAGLQTLPTEYKFTIISNTLVKDRKIKNITLKMKNLFTNDSVEPDIVFVNAEIFSRFDEINNSIDEFMATYPLFQKINDKDLILPKGVYTIDETIIIPKGLFLTIEPGVKMQIHPGKSIVSYSRVKAIGTKENPIMFLPFEQKKSWGNFALIEKGADGSAFEYCQFEYGGTSYINGIPFSGMLASHKATISITNCKFGYAQGDDGINIKYGGESNISKSYFYENSGDAIDYDWTDGIIADSYFYKNGNDGIDISGSNTLLKNNFINLSGDKCISVGEKSNPVVINNVLNGCVEGLAIKDLSEAIVIYNTIISNKVGLALYEKKPIFGGGKTSVLNTLIWDNEKSISLDTKSNITIAYSNVEGGFDGEKISSVQPVFIDSRKNFLLSDIDQNKELLNGGKKNVAEYLRLNKFDIPDLPVVGVYSKTESYIPF